MRRLLVVLLLAATLGFLGRGGLPCDAIGVQPRCYVGLYPGPTADTLTIVELSGADVSRSTGQLLLTTVSVDSELSLAEWVRATLSPSVRTVDRELIFPAGTATEDVRAQNAAMMDESQLIATIAGLRGAGLEFDTDTDGSEVVEVADYSAALGILKPGDVLVRGNGDAIRSNADLGRVLSTLGVGDTVEVEVVRAGIRHTLTVPMVAAPDTGDPVIGVTVRTWLDLPVAVHIDAGVVGGPSAGMMFALAIVDQLTPADLTNGQVIAGTGEIDVNGLVGRIGGIQQKILGAMNRQDGGDPATVFLVPAGNLEEALGTPVHGSILLVPITTLHDAVLALGEMAAGRQPLGATALTG